MYEKKQIVLINWKYDLWLQPTFRIFHSDTTAGKPEAPL